MASIMANTPIFHLQVASYIFTYERYCESYLGDIKNKGQYYHCYIEGDRHNFTNICIVCLSTGLTKKELKMVIGTSEQDFGNSFLIHHTGESVKPVPILHQIHHITSNFKNRV